ncbi:tRNA splicing endonuclease 54 [Balamuthia mandrillaris]
MKRRKPNDEQREGEGVGGLPRKEDRPTGSKEQELRKRQALDAWEAGLLCERGTNRKHMLRGEYLSSSSLVRLTSPPRGKQLQNMGFQRERHRFLYPEEALYLIEQGKLELMGPHPQDNHLPLSLQQAFALLLGQSNSHRRRGNRREEEEGEEKVEECRVGFPEYMAYSHLRQIGFIVKRHKHESTAEAESQEYFCYDVKLPAGATANPLHHISSPHFRLFVCPHRNNTEESVPSLTRMIIHMMQSMTTTSTLPTSLELSLDSPPTAKPTATEKQQTNEATEKKKTNPAESIVVAVMQHASAAASTATTFYGISPAPSSVNDSTTRTSSSLAKLSKRQHRSTQT